VRDAELKLGSTLATAPTDKTLRVESPFKRSLRWVFRRKTKRPTLRLRLRASLRQSGVRFNLCLPTAAVGYDLSSHCLGLGDLVVRTSGEQDVGNQSPGKQSLLGQPAGLT
jgi:hypothetical protein